MRHPSRPLARRSRRGGLLLRPPAAWTSALAYAALLAAMNAGCVRSYERPQDAAVPTGEDDAAFAPCSLPIDSAIITLGDAPPQQVSAYAYVDSPERIPIVAYADSSDVYMPVGDERCGYAYVIGSRRRTEYELLAVVDDLGGTCPREGHVQPLGPRSICERDECADLVLIECVEGSPDCQRVDIATGHGEARVRGDPASVCALVYGTTRDGRAFEVRSHASLNLCWFSGCD